MFAAYDDPSAARTGMGEHPSSTHKVLIRQIV